MRAEAVKAIIDAIFRNSHSKPDGGHGRRILQMKLRRAVPGWQPGLAKSPAPGWYDPSELPAPAGVRLAILRDKSENKSNLYILDSFASRARRSTSGHRRPAAPRRRPRARVLATRDQKDRAGAEERSAGALRSEPRADRVLRGARLGARSTLRMNC